MYVSEKKLVSGTVPQRMLLKTVARKITLVNTFMMK